MIKLSDLKSAQQVLKERQRDPQFCAEWDRAALARDIALRIVRYRTENNLSQTALARRVGITQSVIARLESGDQPPSMHTLAKLSQNTGVSFEIKFTHGSIEFAGA